jgi:prepilin-type N-terminal cleavage/methylation domain-containing protein
MQRGFSLVEMALTVGILAMLLFAGAAFALGSRPVAMNSAATGFEAQFEAARSLAAATGNGATIVVQPRVPLGFKSIVYAGRPTAGDALAVTSVPQIASDAEISEAGFGRPPFAIFISGSGHVSMAGSYPSAAQFDSPVMTPIASEPACPAAGSYALTFSANGAARTLDLACRPPG